jgi:superfamily II DNA or RNA helicase
MSRISFDNINSWQDFKFYAESLPNKKQMGDAFEHLTYLYFKLDPKYSFYDEVYKMSDVPTSDLEKLNIPRQDLGIDLIAKVGDDYHPIQCKYHTEKKRSITFSEVSTFLTQLESNTNFKMGYIASTADNTSKNYDKLNTKEVQKLLNNTWYKLDESFFNGVREFEKGREYSPKPFYPREHQKTAVENAYKHFIKENNSRGKLIFPCGAGKSLTGYWMMEKLASKSTIVAVPSLSLIKQTLDVYLKEVAARNKSVKWLCICSDEGIGKNDDVLYKTSEVGVPCTTDVEYIKSWLLKNKEEEIIIFTTYQSGRIIADISKSLDFTFDLGIYDEAHKTVGKNEGLFSYLLFEKNISIKNRIFMTATERFYRGVKDDVLTMDDPEDYGEVFSHMSFKEAIERELLTDYKVITIEVKKEEVAEFIKENNLVKLNAKWGKESEARSLASMIALRKAMKAFPIKNAVSFHSSIDRAVRSKEVQNYISETYNYQPIETFTVSGKLPTSKREVVVNEFANSNKALITNSRCLTEGVDVPNIDCIVFADPRKSKVDIVQALGRALRKKKGKDWGYVIIPIIYDHSTQEIDNDNFQEILNIVRGLAANDERIIEEFKDKSNNKGKIIGAREEIFSIDPVLLEESELANNLSIRLWENLSRFNWMAFEVAREYVRGLNLLNATEWKIYSSSKRRPHNLPSTPNKTYLKSGWVNWGDFLGTGNIAAKYFEFLSYEDARNYARNLNLKSVNEWYDLNETRPSNIPSVPKKTYENSGWAGWGDFLGIADYKPNDEDWLSFKKARSFVRKLGLKNKVEWDEIKKTDKIPYNIPKSPDYVYENWKSVGDWIGTGRIADQYKSYLDFEDARKFMSENNIKSTSQWRKYRKENIIKNIPYKLERTYKKKWKGEPHFFGTEILSYEDAKEFLQKKGLQSSRDYYAYIRNAKIEVNLPSVPSRKYKKKGWVNWKEYLGYSEIKRNRKKEYLDIERARKILRPLNLLSSRMYFDYLKNNPEFKLKHKLCGDPHRIYKNKGWKGYQDYLGYSNDVRKKELSCQTLLGLVDLDQG